MSCGQPLTGITMQIAAARRFLEWTPPNIGEARDMLEQMTSASYHSAEVIESFRVLLKNKASEQALINVVTPQPSSSLRIACSDSTISSFTASPRLQRHVASSHPEFGAKRHRCNDVRRSALLATLQLKLA
jgi:hypothetical protein